MLWVRVKQPSRRELNQRQGQRRQRQKEEKREGTERQRERHTIHNNPYYLVAVGKGKATLEGEDWTRVKEMEKERRLKAGPPRYFIFPLLRRVFP